MSTPDPIATSRPPVPRWRRAGLAVAVAAALAVSCGGDRTADSEPAASPAAPLAEAAFQLPPREYPPQVAEPLRTALAAYEEARALLAADTVDGLDLRARRLAAALAAAAEGSTAGGAGAAPDDAATVRRLLEGGRRAAEGLAGADGLAAARAAFGEVSRFLMPVAAADARLVDGLGAYSCPMVEDGFGKWFQRLEEMENPYMGQEMLTCGTAADWTVHGVAGGGEAAAHAATVHGDDDAVAFWTCPMHPSVESPDPGSCPLCGMDLVPVTAGEVASGVVVIDEARRQTIGVETATVVRRALTGSLRAVGRVVWDETRLTDVSVKIAGFIGELHADEPGQAVTRGQALFTLYSPELYAAQQEYLTALASQRTALASAAPGRADYLVRASRERLRLWDLAPAQIDRLAANGRPVEHIPILSPVTGVVVDKAVVEGSAVQPGMRIFRIAGLDRVWVEAEVYESELPRVAVGQAATVTLPSLPGETFHGRVGFVYPYLDGASRTGRVRVELANPGHRLKPEMYADVELASDLGERLVVAQSAVLHAGPRDFVFVDLGEGRLEPRQVALGAAQGEWVEVLSGVAEGEVIVTSGNFLVAAESRLRAAIEQWR